MHGRPFAFLIASLTITTTLAAAPPKGAPQPAPAATSTVAPPPALKIEDCTLESVKARCGTLTLPEKPGSARMIELGFVVVPATEKNDSPIFPMAGGPGDTLVDGVADVPELYAGLLRRHDVVLLDERGTGRSAPLKCDAAMASYRDPLVGGPLMPLDFVRDCRAEVEKSGADLTAYTFPYFADDVEALRRALGYGPINLVAISYGTRAALTYYERHPASVRSLTLVGPVAPEAHAPLQFARDAQDSLTRLVALCKGDSNCKMHYPQLGEILSGLASRIEANPRRYDWTEPLGDHHRYPLTITVGSYNEWLRTQLYTRSRMAELPRIIYAYNYHDPNLFVRSFVAYRKNWYDAFPLFMTVTCASDVRYIKPSEVAAATKETFLGSYRVDAQMKACEAWTPGTVPLVKIPKSGKAPILMITGELDPVTPKRWADAIAKAAPNTRTVVLTNSAHGDIGACHGSLMASFIDAGSHAKLDDSCAKTLEKPAFNLN